MTRRTVMAAWLRPSSPRPGPRNVYICLPDHAGPDQQPRVQKVLRDIVRAGDRLLYASSTGSAVAAFGERYGNSTGPIDEEGRAPDLIVIIVDPLGDNTSALEARTLAAHGDSDLLIAELPDPS